MKKDIVIKGQHIIHRINRTTGQCSCRFTHPQLQDNSWDITQDTKFGQLTEIKLFKNSPPDIYIHWPF